MSALVSGTTVTVLGPMDTYTASWAMDMIPPSACVSPPSFVSSRPRSWEDELTPWAPCPWRRWSSSCSAASSTAVSHSMSSVVSPLVQSS